MMNLNIFFHFFSLLLSFIFSGALGRFLGPYRSGVLSTLYLFFTLLLHCFSFFKVGFFGPPCYFDLFTWFSTERQFYHKSTKRINIIQKPQITTSSIDSYAIRLTEEETNFALPGMGSSFYKETKRNLVLLQKRLARFILVKMSLEALGFVSCAGFPDYFVNRNADIVNREGKSLLVKIRKGRAYVHLTNAGSSGKSRLVSILVANAFIPNPENKRTVDHIDQNPLNNCASNLRWFTHKEQCGNRGVHVTVTLNQGFINDTNQTWMPLSGVKDYLISSLGCIKDATGKVYPVRFYLEPKLSDLHPSPWVRIKGKYWLIGNLVAGHFLPKPDEKYIYFLKYKDGDVKNYALSNLYWVRAGIAPRRQGVYFVPL